MTTEQDALKSSKDISEPKDAGSSLAKMLSILDVFTPERPIWSGNDIIQRLDTSRSTGYRYIKALNKAGLLSALGNGHYLLGPRIIELDLQIRGGDPLLLSAKGVLEQLVDATGHSALLCTLYRNSVVCIREHLAPLSPEHMFSRGQRRSLFRGAASKVILAQLPNHRQRAIFARHSADITAANLGTSWEEFRSALSKIRKQGHAVTTGETIAGVVGVAAPICVKEGGIIGSVGIAFSQNYLGDVDLKRLAILVKSAAREITTRTEEAIPMIDAAT